MPAKLLSKLTKRIFEEGSLSFATFIVTFFYFISAFIGLFRNRILAQYFGDSVELGVFYMADKLPNFIFSMIVITTASTAFIPVFYSIKKKSESKSVEFMSNVLNVSLAIYLLIALTVYIFAPFFSKLVSWYSISGEALDLLTFLMRVMLLSQVGLIVSTYFSIYLQAYKRFVVSAMVPVIYNLSVVLFTMFGHKSFGIYAPAYGMILGSFVCILIQLPAIKNINYNYRFYLNFRDSSIRKVLSVTAPRILGVSAHRLYTLFLGGMISLVYKSPSYLVVYEFANQLQTMPVNAFGSSFSQAVFPTISDYASNSRFLDVAKLARKYLLRIFYFVFPLSVLFIVLKIPLVRLLFGGDKFSWLGTNLTAYTLAFFSLSIVFQAVSVFFTRMYYSLHDSKTPNLINVITLAISFVLAYLFGMVFNFGVWSFALAFSISSITNAVLLYYFLIPTFGNFLVRDFYKYAKIIYSALASGFVTYLLMKYLEQIVFDTTRTLSLFTLTALITFVGGVLYIFLADIFGINFFKSLVLKFSKRFFNSFK